LGTRGIDLPLLDDATTDRLAELLPPLTYQRNPVDTGRPGETFPAVVRTVADAPGIDVVGVYALDEPGALDPVAALEPVAGRVVFASGGPVADLERVRPRLDALGVPLCTSPHDLAVGLAALVADARARFVPDAPAASPTRRLGRALDEDEAKTLLAKAGVRVP